MMWRRLCPEPVDGWTARLKFESASALVGAKLRAELARQVVEETREVMDRYRASEKRNHFREQVENQFGGRV